MFGAMSTSSLVAGHNSTSQRDGIGKTVSALELSDRGPPWHDFC